jgi:hypothetical protein
MSDDGTCGDGGNNQYIFPNLPQSRKAMNTCSVIRQFLGSQCPADGDTTFILSLRPIGLFLDQRKAYPTYHSHHSWLNTSL